MLLRIGKSSLEGSFARYAQRFDLLELRAEPGTLPRTSHLHGWRETAPDGFVFSVMLPTAVASLEPGQGFDDALDYALQVVQVLQARWIVLKTPPSATPSRRTVRRLTAVVDRLPRDDCRIAWESRGLWESEQEARICSELGLTLVRDLRRHEAPGGSCVYTRLPALGSASRFTVDAAELVAQRAEELEELFVVVEGEGARQGAEVLRRSLGASE